IYVTQTQTSSESPTASQTEVGIAIGTLPYMSPEQLLGHAVDHRTDFFSLGCVFYEIVTGRQTFSGNSKMAIADKILHEDPVLEFHKKTTPALQTMIKRLLAKKREDRYQTATALVSDLQKLKPHEPISTRTSTAKRIAMSSAILILIMITGGVMWLYRRNE